jgi:UDP-N-acetylglucosamine 4,6-dehydratase
MKYLILGGTGTLGQEITRQLLKKQDTETITCLSRDELKQGEMKRKFSDQRLRFVLGDIRNYDSIWSHFHNQDVVFHVAALKHVDILETNPEESVRTNVLGTMNSIDACVTAGVRTLAFSSTDKAVDPVNVYGMCKGISERLLFQKEFTKTFRWGNVIGSRGSAIHSFAKTLKEENTAYITDPKMSRFWIKIEDAAAYMIDIATDRFISASKVFIPPMKAAKVTRIIASVARVLGVTDYALMKTPIRPGEKIHEVLESQHVKEASSEKAPQYTDSELDEMIRGVLCPS